MIDFPLINSTALLYAQSLVQKWVPGGLIRGREYVVRNPTRADSNAGSFSINTETGIWKDFATKDGGDDLISLYAYLFNVSQSDAAKEVASQCNVADYNTVSSVKNTNNIQNRKKITWKPIFPVPDDVPEPPSVFKRNEGTKGNIKSVSYPITHYWAYRNEHGALLGYVTRFQGPLKKETPPLTYCCNSDNKRDWRFLGFPEPKPLFNWTRIAQAPKQKILIVEGEKCAQALQELYDTHGIPITVVTWCGGVDGVKKANWQLLKGRDICIWPDSDKQKYPKGHKNEGEIMPYDEQPGFVAAVEIAT
ncbi:MAG TPA: hypothetical protein VHO70_15910, partial [Chitinispirillaceae bacterium]|nr:hypothetical protein [Chitinispirillaceae bacterium]